MLSARCSCRRCRQAKLTGINRETCEDGVEVFVLVTCEVCIGGEAPWWMLEGGRGNSEGGGALHDEVEVLLVVPKCSSAGAD